MKVSSAEAEIKLKNSSRFTFLPGNITIQTLRGATDSPRSIVQIITVNLSSPFATSHIDRDFINLLVAAAFAEDLAVQLFSRATSSTFATSSIAARQVSSTNAAADFESARAGALARAKVAAKAKARLLRIMSIL